MMDSKKLNENLINAVKEKIPNGSNLVNTLTNILFIGKEAVYRRLRGEVSFTLWEATTISQHLNISIDKLSESVLGASAVFNLNLIHHADPIETYYNTIHYYNEVIEKIKFEIYSELYTSSNVLPHTICLRYKNIAKFLLFKWMYQHQTFTFNKTFDELILPEKIYITQKKFADENLYYKYTCFIWDSMIFSFIINDINYYNHLELLTAENIKELKSELLEMLNEIELLASKGINKLGNKVQIYISNINFEGTYSFINSPNYHLSLINIFSINNITSKDLKIFEHTQTWIRSLKRFSILISESGEMQRIQFLKQQRKLINELI